MLNLEIREYVEECKIHTAIHKDRHTNKKYKLSLVEIDGKRYVSANDLFGYMYPGADIMNVINVGMDNLNGFWDDIQESDSYVIPKSSITDEEGTVICYQIKNNIFIPIAIVKEAVPGVLSHDDDFVNWVYAYIFPILSGLLSLG